ncbi:MAG: hypothetical protein NC187_00065, partial [Candidatus Amulumruptor caecigallinarius]|nr:hypothetical protein [Candidatus Amulumruptor caecigallinarius]
MKHLLHTIILCLLFVGCTNSGSINRQLTLADAFLENAPDSALLILDEISNRNDLTSETKAYSTMLTAKAKLRKGESFLMVEDFD